MKRKNKFSGKADWEAFHAQFELLAQGANWPEDRKGLELAMCLTDDALNCLSLLNPDNTIIMLLPGHWGDVLGNLSSHGSCILNWVIDADSQESNWESWQMILKILLGEHVPTCHQQFKGSLRETTTYRPLPPVELCSPTQLAHPQTLQDAFVIGHYWLVNGGLRLEIYWNHQVYQLTRCNCPFWNSFSSHIHKLVYSNWRWMIVFKWGHRQMR